MNLRSEGDEAQHTDPPGDSLVPPHKILKVVCRICAYILPQMASQSVPPQPFPILLKYSSTLFPSQYYVFIQLDFKAESIYGTQISKYVISTE